jgi:hypothetical protein
MLQLVSSALSMHCGDPVKPFGNSAIVVAWLPLFSAWSHPFHSSCCSSSTRLLLLLKSCARRGMDLSSGSNLDVAKVIASPTHDVAASRPADQGSICDRCYSIPWELIITPHDSLEYSGYPFPLEDREQLSASTCPVCRFFERVVAAQSTTNQSVKLIWCDNAYNGPSIGTLSLHASAPHILATCMNSVKAQSYLKSVYPRQLDVKLVKAWINECVHRHGVLCNPPTLDRSKHVTRVIDCEQRTVVPGSIECSYVALSYVWGNSNDAEVDAQLRTSFPKLGTRLPRTIEDSIELTRALGIKYLWVDRYVRLLLSQSSTR